MVQFQADKPTRRGIKNWLRCDSTTGYCHQFDTYFGKEVAKSEHGLYFDVVWNLVKDLTGQRHWIFMDNLYSSVHLYRFLYSKGLYACGTLRTDRKNVSDIIKDPPPLARGEHKIVQSSRLSNLLSCVWMDTKQVSFLSTCSDPTVSGQTHRRVAGEHRAVSIPSVAQQYTANMGAVDRLNMYCSKRQYAGLGHNHKKAWKHLFFYFLNLAVVNSFFLYTQSCPNEKKMDHITFRHQLACFLIGGFSSRKRLSIERRFTTGTVLENIGSHSFVKMGIKRPRRCTVHKQYRPDNKSRYETTYGCLQCGQIMCAPCFRLSHCHP